MDREVKASRGWNSVGAESMGVKATRWPMLWKKESGCCYLLAKGIWVIWRCRLSGIAGNCSGWRPRKGHNGLTTRLRSFSNRLLTPSCRGIWNNLTHVQFDHGLTAKKIEQHSHPLAGGDNASDHGPQALKCAGGDFHRVPGMKVMLDDMDFLRAHEGLDFFDDMVWEGRPVRAEMDHAGHALGGLDAAQGEVRLKAGKKVGGEQSLGHPGQPPARGPLEPHTRQKHLDVLVLAKSGGGYVFVSWSCSHAKPCGIESRLRQPLGIHVSSKSRSGACPNQPACATNPAPCRINS